MNLLLLQPTDVLFFRDGRPMTLGLAGHGAAWPLPNITSAALHAALWRSGCETDVHPHRRGRNGQYSQDPAHRDRKFGSLLQAGPFPVRVKPENPAAPDAATTATPDIGTWFFPRPADVQARENPSELQTILRPSDPPEQWTPGERSSLPAPLRYATVSCQPPTKKTLPVRWLGTAEYERYLGETTPGLAVPLPPKAALADTAIFHSEYTVGIGIDPATATQDGKRIYSAHYLRLRDEFRLGIATEAHDKDFPQHGGDLIKALFNGDPARIVVGGQQRICTVRRFDAGPLPFPRGVTTFARQAHGKCRVKWVLLSPALWPEIPPKKKDGTLQNAHPGGWLPNWVFLDWDPAKLEAKPNARNGEVQLTSGPGLRKAERKNTKAGETIHARLVAAIVPKPIVVTGWALANGSAAKPDAGAKSTHLAVPAGAVYYFETQDGLTGTAEEQAAALANALNWHGGDTTFTTIKNRRSTLMGEKGFGLGVCGAWDFYAAH
jgi:hypothetical protein